MSTNPWNFFIINSPFTLLSLIISRNVVKVNFKLQFCYKY
ncbi:hypothetical protein NT04LM_4189 [Listeria monocytogenes FSL F2-208]|nr:hypothetical protein NT04LM_4189 [Listeria monocytogenes FSL F2-208]